MVDAGPSWTKERVELLRRLWKEGRSASQIAIELGGVSRNAVIGKIHRMGLAGRVLKSETGSPVQASGAVRRPRPDDGAGSPSRHGGLTMMAPAPPSLALIHSGATSQVDVGLPHSQRVTIMELRESMCRWPMGDPASPEFRFCGGRAITGLPYCDHHANIAYQPAAERKRDRRIVGFR